MTPVRQHKIAALVGLRVSFGTFRRGAGADDRLQVIRHRVTKAAIAVPRAEGDHLAEFGLNKIPGESNAWIKAAVICDLKHNLPPQQFSSQLLTFFNRDS